MGCRGRENQKKEKAFWLSGCRLMERVHVGDGRAFHVFLFVDRFWDWGRGTGLEAGGAWTGVSEWR
jgi:hypothetical protein